MGGKNIVDHTNEQQRALEQRRQEIAEKKVCHCNLKCRISYVYCRDIYIYIYHKRFWGMKIQTIS